MSSELGEFLRARRADSSPGYLTRGESGRRRVTGLRREEVSTAAGISVDYYTRLEQGRENHPSDAVLDALARVLHLTPDATEHIYSLRGANPSPARHTHGDENLLADRMATLVEAVRPNPAYVLDRLSNMLAANPEGLTLYDGFADMSPRQRNTCRYLMTNHRAQEIFLEWEEIARGAVAHLRAANADNLHDPDLLELVAELRERSALFEEWWSGHIVERRRTSITHIRAMGGDTISRRYEVLHLPEDGLRMTLWLPGT